MLDEYQSAILLHGADWESVRDIARTLEHTIFLAGYYKAFAFLCGPCRGFFTVDVLSGLDCLADALNSQIRRLRIEIDRVLRVGQG